MLENLDGNELCVIVKLVSGENVMAVLQDEDDQYVELLYPMSIRSIPVSTSKESVVAAPLCQYSDDDTYLIDKRNVLFIKKLSHVLIPHYYNMVEEFGESELIRAARNIEKKKSIWEEAEDEIESTTVINNNTVH
jgi:hypothetical protein